MKVFLLRCLLFLAPIFLVLIYLFKADGNTDAFYMRFTSPKQNSLIVGTSRAAQGIQPEVINRILQRNDLYNYSFTIGHSPYGEVYLASIKKKVNQSSRNGIFIVTVDPWAVSTTTEPLDSVNFKEKKLMLGETKYVNISPNFFYLLRSYEKPYSTLFWQRKDSEMFLHNDGWLEVTIPMDSATVARRLKDKAAEYRNKNLPKYKFSEVRWRYLEKTIDFFKGHGEVFIVHMPVHDSLLQIDNALMPDFETRLVTLAKYKSVPYLNFTDSNTKYQYTDGNHLYKTSARIVSEEIAGWIKANINELNSN